MKLSHLLAAYAVLSTALAAPSQPVGSAGQVSRKEPTAELTGILHDFPGDITANAVHTVPQLATRQLKAKGKGKLSKKARPGRAAGRAAKSGKTATSRKGLKTGRKATRKGRKKGGKTPATRKGAKTPAIRKGGKTPATRKGGKTPATRKGGKTAATRKGRKGGKMPATRKGRKGGKTPVTRKGAKTSATRKGRKGRKGGKTSVTRKGGKTPKIKKGGKTGKGGKNASTICRRQSSGSESGSQVVCQNSNQQTVTAEVSQGTVKKTLREKQADSDALIKSWKCDHTIIPAAAIRTAMHQARLNHPRMANKNGKLTEFSGDYPHLIEGKKGKPPIGATYPIQLEEGKFPGIYRAIYSTNNKFLLKVMYHQNAKYSDCTERSE